MLGSVIAHASMAVQAAHLSRRGGANVNRKTMLHERNKNCKVVDNLIVGHAKLRKSPDVAMLLVDAQVKEVCNGYDCELDALRELFNAGESELMQGCDKWME